MCPWFDTGESFYRGYYVFLRVCLRLVYSHTNFLAEQENKKNKEDLDTYRVMEGAS